MKEVGFVKTSMPEETRVGLLPEHIKSSIQNPQNLFIESGYAKHLGASDDAYRDAGANIVDRIHAYERDILCIPKPWIDDVEFFQQGQVLTGWLYLSEKKEIARAVLRNDMTAVAWENMYGPNHEYAFDKNRWYAGYISTTQALPFAKASPKNLKIAVLGRGRVAKGVFARLDEEGATYEFCGRDTYEDLKSRLGEFDVVVNCWYYDPALGNSLTSEDLQEMKSGSLFIDVTCDGVEGSIPHSAVSPLYYLGRFNPIIIYNNNHAPAMWPLEVSECISESAAPFIDKLVKEQEDPFLTNATVVKNGEIIDKRIERLLGL